jgi:NTE family protein
LFHAGQSLNRGLKLRLQLKGKLHMLSIHGAQGPNQQSSRVKTGLAIAGGGPVGAIYELGTLRAFDESINGLKLHELDVYVGVSSGALIAASLANGITTMEMCRIFMGQEYASLRFDPQRLMRPAYREYFQRASMLPAILTDSLLHIVRHPGKSNISELIGELGRVVPSGIFNNETIHHFLEEVFKITGHGDQFDDLACKLFIVAVDLDSGAAVRFGSEGHRNLTISKAVQASAALPGLYPPVEIDGHYYVDGALRRTLHASAALDEGVDLLIGVNPLVPYDAGIVGQNKETSDQKLSSGGLPLILSQTFRALIQSRMEAGFRMYRGSQQTADLVLLEPDRADEEVFFTNIFSYASRCSLCEHAYQVTRNDLLARKDVLAPVLEKHGMSLNMDYLNDKERTLDDSIGEGQSSHASLARNLTNVLDDLDDLLEEQSVGG